MDIQVWWSNLTAADRALAAMLDDRERVRLKSLVRPADQGRFLVGAALVRVAVGAWLDIAPEAVVVDRTCPECGRQHGRPEIRGPGTELPQVSVSHSGVLIVVALAKRPVGIDVERIDASNDSWVVGEAAFKMGAGDPQVHLLNAPDPGYRAAVAVPAGSVPSVQTRSWLPDRPVVSQTTFATDNSTTASSRAVKLCRSGGIGNRSPVPPSQDSV